MDEEPPLAKRVSLVLIALCLLSLFLTKMASADRVWPCYYYGTPEDGHEGSQTAFATWHSAPRWLPLEVKSDWQGVAVQGYAPGAIIRLTIVDLPGWASDELRDELIGRSVLAVVADRPGGDYVDCWVSVFGRLTGGRMWVGKVYVTVRKMQKGRRQ